MVSKKLLEAIKEFKPEIKVRYNKCQESYREYDGWIYNKWQGTKDELLEWLQVNSNAVDLVTKSKDYIFDTQDGFRVCVWWQGYDTN
jgi:hypothetical protein